MTERCSRKKKQRQEKKSSYKGHLKVSILLSAQTVSFKELGFSVAFSVSEKKRLWLECKFAEICLCIFTLAKELRIFLTHSHFPVLQVSAVQLCLFLLLAKFSCCGAVETLSHDTSKQHSLPENQDCSDISIVKYISTVSATL